MVKSGCYTHHDLRRLMVLRRQESGSVSCQNGGNLVVTPGFQQRPQKLHVRSENKLERGISLERLKLVLNHLKALIGWEWLLPGFTAHQNKIKISLEGDNSIQKHYNFAYIMCYIQCFKITSHEIIKVASWITWVKIDFIISDVGTVE